MQSIINDALKNAELEKEMNKPGSTMHWKTTSSGSQEL